jgi:hypothetical protein
MARHRRHPHVGTLRNASREPTFASWNQIEGESPSVLMRLGWNRNSLPAGTRVTVVGFQAKDGSLRPVRDLRFPDGRTMDLGGSGSATQK